MASLGWDENRRIRFHGDRGHHVIVLHGGPAACGSAIRLAHGLSHEFRVIEPWQRRSGDKPLTVAVHMDDLHQLIRSRCKEDRPALVGSSWGAMLALAYAAKHSESIKATVLVGCGTFDKASREVIVKRRRQKIIDFIAKHPEYESDLKLNIDQQMMKWHGMTDSYEPVEVREETTLSEPFDMTGHEETWQDLIRCQNAGIYPQSFTSVKVPVLMLHGADDPHPGDMIQDTLRRFIPHLEYYEFQRCGHEPEIEKYAKDDFFALLSGWLKKKLSEPRKA